MKSGKKVQYVDSNNFLSETDSDTFSYDVFGSVLPDPIRYFSKNYWTLDKNKLIVAKNISNDVMFTLEYLDDSTIQLVANKDKFLIDSIDERGILVRKFDPTKWELFLNNNLPQEDIFYEDFNITFPEPIDLFENPDSNEKNISYIKKDYKYNFFSSKFESLLNDRRTDVTSLPSLLNILNDKQLDSRTYEENLSLTLGGLIPDDYAESLFLANNYSDIVKNYFDVYAETYTKPETATVIRQIGKSNKLVKINDKQISLINNNSFVPFPFYVETRFSNLANNPDSLIHQLNSLPTVKSNLLDYIFYNTSEAPTRNFIYETSGERQIVEYDIKNFINSGISGSISISEPEQNTILTVSDTIEYGKFIDYLRNTVKQTIRKHKDLEKSNPDDQILCYRIDKRQFGYTSNNNIQNFLISPGVSDSIKFIDTQIKYATDYYYTIFAYVMSVGNQYLYKKHDYSGPKGELSRLSDINNGLWKIKVENKAAYKVFEIPFTKFTATIHENPYTKPNIQIKKASDDIRIDLLPSNEQSLDDIKIVENKDFQVLESIRLSQNIIDKTKIQTFSSKNSKNTLEIFKTTNRPTDSLSFQGKLYKTLILDNDSSFTDTLVSNVKFYYAFRYLNEHGVPSDLSNVFEVEMRNEDGYSYLLTNTINLDKQATKSTIKNMKRYLLVRPSINQTIIREKDQVNSSKDIYLGPDEEPVWGKDFIIRLTSKKTNRVLQFNVKAKIER